VKTHAKVTAWMFLFSGTMGVLLAIGSLVLYAVVGGAAISEGERVSDGTAVVTLGFLLAVIVALPSIPNALAGYGLLRRRAWGVPLGMGLAFLYIFFIPIGTVFGIYALTALFDDPYRRSLERA
jgi:hypothetical protein